jgi:cytochrome P450
MSVQQAHESVREIPITYGGDRLKPRLPLKDLAATERIPSYRFPNGVTGWVTTTAEDFRALLGDPRLHAKRFVGEPQAGTVSVEVPEMPGFIPGLNGPEHLRIRRLVAGEFSVKAVEARRQQVEEIVDSHLDNVEKLGSPIDLYANYTLPIPSEVIARLLGVERSDHHEFQHAAASTIGAGAGTADADADEAARAVASLHKIVAATAERRRSNPQDDIISKLVAAGLSVEEVCGVCTNLLLAGHETTSTSSALSIAFLLTRTEQLQAFLAHPEKQQQAVEELIRFVFLVSDNGANIPRLVTEDMEYQGYHFKQGDWVMLPVSTANTDPDLSSHPDLTELNLDRTPYAHLTFGYGAHTCLGQHLARLELGIILPRFFQRFPNAELVTPLNEIPWIEEGFGYRMDKLMVRW